MPKSSAIAATPTTIGMISLGCAKNMVDSEIIAAHARSAGFAMAPRPEQADIVIVNTCAFIHDAQEESIDAILEACAWKAAGHCRAVMVCGCLPQRYRYALARELPEVDAFIGLDAIPEIGQTLRRLDTGERNIRLITKTAEKIIEPPPGRPLFTNGAYAYLKVAEGCNHRCAFCAIPAIRGAYRSRPIAAIVREAEELLQRGVRELNLISQDITAYGCDLNNGNDLPRLLRALNDIGGRFWIRLLYGHPAHVTEKLLDTIGELPRVCHYLDLPIQHSHPAILTAMRRPQPHGGLESLFQTIRRHLPDVTLRTTCLLGFPGETADHFDHLLDFTTAIRFNHLGVFEFSPEVGTHAVKLKRRVPKAVIQQRVRRLMLRQQHRVKAAGLARIGQTDPLLIDATDPHRPNVMLARSAACAPEVDGVVYLTNLTKQCRPGAFIKARYTGVRGYDMEAEPFKRGA
jgi:ribosomal protein S12 methylthiotransferase